MTSKITRRVVVRVLVLSVYTLMFMFVLDAAASGKLTGIELVVLVIATALLVLGEAWCNVSGQLYDACTIGRQGIDSR